MYARRLLTHCFANMRELGGYTTRHGHMTQWKRFVRSNMPHANPSPADLQYLRDYGIGTVIDLRCREEAASEPSPFVSASGFDYQNISFTDDFSLLGDVYYCPRDHLVEVIKGPTRIAEILKYMARSQGACLFFCFAGKDRTGVIAALLLMLAQVDTDDVAADYQVTYTYIRGIGTLFSADNDIGKRPAFLADKDKTLPARPEELRRTEPEWLQPFMDYVQGFGGAERYLSHLGLSHDEITRLRDRILL